MIICGSILKRRSENKMKTNRLVILAYFLFLIFFTISPVTNAQYFSSGQDPASVKWNQINTTHFQIVFPDYAEETAQYITNILDTVYYIDSQALKHHPDKITLILRTNSVISNGFVGIAPRRIEYFNTPPQDIYPQDWFQQLALHEYRHVVQTSKVKQDFTRILTWFTGQQGWAAVVGSYVPFWFLEGDAVYAETKYSHAGRGRMPLFTMPLRAQITQKGLYPYDKAVFGSYKDFVPDHYVLGYHLVAMGRKQYNDELWNQTLNIVAKKPWMIVPFSEGIRKVTGYTKTDYYRKALGDLKLLWIKQIRNGEKQKQEIISKKSPDYTSYRFPVQGRNKMVYAIKNSLHDITSIVSINMFGKEEIIHRPGNIQYDNLSYSQGQLCWAERKPDARWGNRSFSDIFIMDIKTRKVKQLTKKTRYFAPELSHTGNKIAAVEVTKTNHYYLVILNSRDGNPIKRIEPPNNDFIQKPKWSLNDQKIIFTVLGDNGKRITIYDPNNNTFKNLTPACFTEISQPLIYNDTVYFIGTYKGLNDIYAFTINDNKLFKISNTNFGISDVRILTSKRKLIYSDYTSNGYQIASKKILPEQWKFIDNKEVTNLTPYAQINDSNRTVLSEKIIRKTKHNVKKYSKILHLFDFHSWAPVYFNLNDEEVKPGITLLSQNKLSTNFTTLTYRYDPNEKTGRYKINMSYHGWYPVIDFTAEHGKRKGVTRDSMDNPIDYSFRETILKAGVSVPLRYTRNHYYYGIQPGITASQTFLHEDKKADNSIRPSDFTSLEYRIYLYRYRKSSVRDLQPKWGQILDLSFINLPFETDFRDYSFSAEGRWYFPGLMHHDGFRIYTAFETQKESVYSFASNISIPRGFSNLYYKYLYSFKTDYVFPLAYPDMSIISIAYIKRLKGSVFFDYALGKNPNQEKAYNSVGFDLTADLHLLRFIAPFDMGLRTIYLPEENKFVFRFLFAIDYVDLY